MSGKTFLDTNIAVYLYSGDEPEKRGVALSFIEQNNSVVSTQVLSELANTLSRKFSLTFDVVAQAVGEVRDACTVVPVMPDTIEQALALVQKYRYSYYDSLILTAALAAGCETLATEDMQHGQVIEGVLTIRNPFKNDCDADPISFNSPSTMVSQTNTLDASSILMLRKIVGTPFGISAGVKAIKFRADNHQYRNSIDALVNKRFIENRNEKYFITLKALPEIVEDSPVIRDLISWCEVLFSALRQAYLNDPGGSIKIQELEGVASLTTQQIATCIPLFWESSILGSWTTDIYASDAYVSPAERILDYESF